jgi:hypothetical protein
MEEIVQTKGLPGEFSLALLIDEPLLGVVCNYAPHILNAQPGAYCPRA